MRAPPHFYLPGAAGIFFHEGYCEALTSGRLANEIFRHNRIITFT